MSEIQNTEITEIQNTQKIITYNTPLEGLTLEEKAIRRRLLQRHITKERYKNDKEFRETMKQSSKARYKKMSEAIELIKSLKL